MCESESTEKKSDDKGSDGRASSAAKTTLRASLHRSECEADRLLHVVQWRRQCGGKRSRGPPHSKYEDQKHATPADTTLLCAAEVIPQAGRWASTKIAAHTALGLRVK